MRLKGIQLNVSGERNRYRLIMEHHFSTKKQIHSIISVFVNKKHIFVSKATQNTILSHGISNNYMFIDKPRCFAIVLKTFDPVCFVEAISSIKYIVPWSDSCCVIKVVIAFLVGKQ